MTVGQVWPVEGRVRKLGKKFVAGECRQTLVIYKSGAGTRGAASAFRGMDQ